MTLLAALALAGAAAAAPALAGASPYCTPATRNTSALLAGGVTVSPMPGSRDAPPQTQISLLGAPPRYLQVVSVVGSRSGLHPGRLLAYSQGDGASFLPARPFAEGERVTVHARVRTVTGVRPIVDEFTIADQDAISSTPEATYAGGPAEFQTFHSAPELHPPSVTVSAQNAATAPGDVFVAPYSGPGQAGPMILDPAGGLVWFKPLPAGIVASNLQVQEYLGAPVLTWWQGNVSIHGFGLGQDVIANSSYSEIAHVRAGNGLQADLHDFQLTPEGTALVTAYEPIRCNLSLVGGSASGALTDALFQEIDVKTGLVMFQWTSLDHVALYESYERAANSSLSSPFDYFHINSIDRESDGSVLVSARNTWTVYEVDPSTGQIGWRLGGRDSSFARGAGVGTAWQHDARELADGLISLFDNGASPQVHGQSRGIVLNLNEQSGTAALVTQIVHPSPLLSDSQGNMQQLSNGDWFVGWGQVPDFSEFNSSGELLFDAHFPVHTQSYRAFRFAWTGTPAEPPAFVLRRPPGGGETVYASWNGATQVASWRVLTGQSAASMEIVAVAERSGFETAIKLPASHEGPYVTVQALDASGAVLATAPLRTLEEEQEPLPPEPPP